MESKKTIPVIVVFGILTVITVFVWIGFDVYRALTKEPSPSVPEEVSAELDPNLDTEALARVTQSVHLEDSEIGDTQLIDIDTLSPNQDNSDEEAVAPVQEVPEENTQEEGIVQEGDQTVSEEATDEGQINQ